MNTSPSRILTTGCGRKITVQDIVRMYREMFSESLPESGKIQRLSNNIYSLTIQSKATCCDTFEAINTFKIYTLRTKTDGSNESFESILRASDMHQVGDVMSATSLNGRFIARIKNANGPSSKRQLLEIWDKSKLIKTYDTSQLDDHGSINIDSTFAKFVWMPYGEQDKLLYVCQPKRPKYASFFKDVANTKEDDPTNRGEEYIRRKNWGECLDGIEHTMIGVLDVANNCRISTLNLEGYSLGCPSWLDNGSKIVSVAYKEEPRLGLVYCNNKESKIVIHEWQHGTDGKPIIDLEVESESLHSPRVNNKGDQFIYLSVPSYGAHRHSDRIHLYDLKTKESKRLVDKDHPEMDIFVESIPNNCFTTDDKRFVFVSQKGLSTQMNTYMLETSQIWTDSSMTGFSILDFHDNIVLASTSRIVSTPTILVAVLNIEANHNVIEWHRLIVGSRLHGIKYSVVDSGVENQPEISAILVEPDLLKAPYKDELPTQDSSRLPTIVFVHGGPNAACLLRYTPRVVLDARLGFKTLMINYRGSSGVSEEHVQSICGKVSEYDVDDCLLMIRHFVKQGLIDSEKLIIAGGSHGGFLSAHLSCQDEFKFTSAVIRNPVIDMSSLRATSDIPEWCFNVGLGHKHYDQSHVPTREELIEFYKRSPISRVSKARVPTLMMLGKNDRRVNMYQGELWIDILRAMGIETLCKVYDDKHALDKPETFADGYITAAIWMLDHLHVTQK